MSSVAVIGAGAWGTALAAHAARLGHGVRVWAREDEVVRDINEARENKTFLPGVSLVGDVPLSWFDLVGFHALLAGYGTWFTVRAAYSLPQSVVDRELERSLDEHIRGRRGARRRERRVAQLGPPGVERRRR